MSNKLCAYGYDDCSQISDDKCLVCIDGFLYQPIKLQNKGFVKKVKTKETKRQGSYSEVLNNRRNNEALSIVSSGTPNSGAGQIKGDEHIRGLVNVLEEIKTTVSKNINKAPGKESFTIKREWLDKIEQQVKDHNMEFGYLKFSFKEFDDKFYCVTNSNIITDIILTMASDRKEKNDIKKQMTILERKSEYLEAKNTELESYIRLLEAELSLYKQDKEID